MVLTDFSKRAEDAAEYAWNLALNLDANILFYNAFHAPKEIALETAVFPDVYGNYSIAEEESNENLSSLTERLKKKFQATGEEREPFVICKSMEGNLADNIEKVLDHYEIWMIVMGDKSNNSFFSHLILGSDSNTVLKKANRPVLMIPENTKFRNLRKIAFALDSLKHSDLEALDFLIGLASPFDAEIAITHVSPKNITPHELHQHVQNFNKVSSVLNYRKIIYIDLSEDNVIETLVKFAQLADLDMITLVQKKSLFYQQLFQESNTNKMINYHILPLLVFPAL